MAGNRKKVLITGAAGFIGMHLSEKLLKKNFVVVGIDNLNDYYDVRLKKERIKNLKNYKNFHFYKVDLLQVKKLEDLMSNNSFEYVINLAAQAGVRYSIENPSTYIENNIKGFLNLLDILKSHDSLKTLFYASSSSIYGSNEKMPFKEIHNTDNPLAIYGVSKKTNELMASAYSYLYKMNIVGLRFFTVYGPWGRPDMALFKFIEAIKSGKKIEVFNSGNMLRDFTYIDDITEAIFKLLTVNHKDHEIYNIGRGKPVNLMNFITSIENNLGKKAKFKFLPMQKGDVKKTHSSVHKLFLKTGFKPKISVDKGIKEFVKWHNEFYS
jgi:UDP-glucuronate 4-epimerase